jgi:hypothetical protein
MIYRLLLVILLGLCWALSGEPVHAQEGRIFAGGFYETLYAAIDMDHLRVRNPDLRYKVLDRHVAAVIVPASLPPGQFYVLVGGRDSTELTKANLTKPDFDLLRDFAQDGIFLIMEEVRASPNDKAKTRELQQRVAALPASEQESAKRMIGARMADLNLPESHPMGAYVQAYQTHVESRTRQILSNQPNKFENHKPYSFGTPPVSQGSLPSIPPGHVKVITVDGKEYQQAWVDGSLIVVPQSKSPVAEVKNGASSEKTHFDPHVVKNVKSDGGKKPVQTHHQR